MSGPGWKRDRLVAGVRLPVVSPMKRTRKSAALPAAELKRLIPNVAVVARDLYGIDFKKGVARCHFPGNHAHGDRDPSLRHDRKKDRLFCASQNCFGAKGVDAIGLVRRIDGCTFPSAIQKLADHYGIQNGNHYQDSLRRRTKSRSEAPADSRRCALPVLAEKVRQRLSLDGFHPVVEFMYGASHRKVRFEHKSTRQADKDRAEKTFRWEHVVNGTWYSGDGEIPRPLYVNRAFLERDQVGMALGFEGEAKAELAGELAFAAFSFKDLTPEQAMTLVDCDVVLWPDNDASGTSQAETAAGIIENSKHAGSIGIVTLPPDFPAAGDIIDAVKRLGWDRTRIGQIVAEAASYTPNRTTDSEIPGTENFRPVGNFQVSGDGVYFLKEREDGSREPIALAARVDVVAETRDAGGNNWGRLLTWRDNEGRQHQWAMPMELLASDAGAVRARLLGEGLPFISTNLRLRERFTEYLQRAPVERRVLCVPRIGWQGGAYVLPDVAFGSKDGEQILYQPPNDSSHFWAVKGTAEQWRQKVGELCRSNSRLVLAVSCGFTGPLLALVNAESGGIHFRGASSTGKTTVLIVGGSVCGGGGQAGFVQPWRATINGLEGVAEAHNDGTLFLDELAQVGAAEAADTAYLLANGQGKTRMTRTMSVRKKMAWRLLFVSTGELTLSEHAASVGKRTKGGAEVRMLNIEADAGRGCGIFEDLHGFSSPELFVRQLREAAQKHYGAPLRAFLENLVRDREVADQMIHEARESLARLIPAEASGELRRAADRFALIGAAGALATRWGLTGWQPGEAIDCAQRCFAEWIRARGTVGSSDVEMGISAVRVFLASHGSSRFQPMERSVAGSRANVGDEAPTIRDRAGFRRRNRDTDETEYLIFRDTFRTEVCAGRDSQAVARELDKKGLLLRDLPSLMTKPHLPELGKTWMYGIRAAILAVGE